MSSTAPPIALSTGWLFAHDRDTFSAQKPFLDAADGAELSVTMAERFSSYEEAELPVEYLSFHLSQSLPESEYDRLAALVHTHTPRTAVLHPVDLVPSTIHRLRDRDIPLAIENMDSQKPEGIHIDVLQDWLVELDLEFVLDVQHAYEHDPTMQYAWDLVEMAGDRLIELHVSGETESHNHALVQNAENRKTILQFLTELAETGVQVPLVIEGEYRTVAEVKQEVALLREAYSPPE